MLPRRISVKTEVNLVNGFQKLSDVIAGDGSPERRNRLPKARLRELDHVHITLADNGAPGRAHGVRRLIEPVDFKALMVNRGFRAV